MKKLLLALISLSVSFYGLTDVAYAIAAPTNVVVTSASAAGTGVNSASISVAFSKVTGGISYRVKASSSTKDYYAGPVSFAASDASNPTGTINVDGLAGGTSYSVTVEVIDQNSSAISNPVTFIAKSIPDEPGITSAVKGVGQVTLTWTAPSNTGGLPLTGYTISASGSDTNVEASATTKVISNLSPGAIYKFTIVAKNSLGSSTSASFAEVQIPDKPSTPGAPTITKDGTSITATWTAPNDNGSTISKYTATLTSDSGATTSKDVVGSTSTTFTSLTNGTYSVKVVATNDAGSSSSSPSSNTQTIATSSLTPNDPLFAPTTIPNMEYGGSQSVTVTVPSAGVVTLTGTSGICTVTGTGPFTVTAAGIGTCTLTATSPATSAYDAAFGTKSFTINKATPVITFAAITDKTMPGPLTLSATVSPSQSITYSVSGAGVCALQGSNQVQFIGAGSCSATASVSATSTQSAASVTRTFNITAASSGGTISGGGGGGGGGGPKQTAAYFMVVDPTNSSARYSKSACVEVYSTDLFPQFKGQACSTSESTINLLLTDGGVTVRVYDVGYGTNYRTYHGKIENDAFIMDDATFFPGTTRYSVTVPSAAVPKPVATPTPTPVVTPAPTPTPVASPSTKPDPNNPVTPSVTTTPTPTSSVVPVTLKNYLTTSTAIANTYVLVGSKSSYSSSIKLAKTFQLKTGILAKGTIVKLVMTASDGKSFTITTKTLTKSSSYISPTLKFAKAGSYQMKLTLGKSTKIVAVKVTK